MIEENDTNASFPRFVFGIFFDSILVLWSWHSAAAILLTTLLALLFSF